MGDKALFVINFNGVLCDNSRKSMIDACRRWDCDYIEITEQNCPISLDVFPEHCFPFYLKHHKPSYLKHRVFDLCSSDRIFVIDADTIIRSDCPSPFAKFPEDAFVAVTNTPPGFSQLDETIDIQKAYWEKFSDKYSLPIYEKHIFFNSGVLLVNRIFHKLMYEKAHEIALENTWDRWPEQTPLNFAVAAGAIKYISADTTWNKREPANLVYMTDYIYHCAGVPNREIYLKQVNWYARGKLNTRDELGVLLNQLNLSNTGVEVGAWRGYYSERLLNTWNGEKLYLVDIWKHQKSGYYNTLNASDTEHENNYKLTLQSIQKFSGRCEIIRKFSVEAAEMFEDGSLDFVYIDANHTYEAVIEDLNAWYPKVKCGGIVAGHDFLEGGIPFGVKRAVTDFIANKKVSIFVTTEEWPTWYFIKLEG